MDSVMFCWVKDMLSIKLAAVKTKTIAIMSSAAFIRIVILLLYHKNVEKSSVRRTAGKGRYLNPTGSINDSFGNGKRSFMVQG